MKAGDVIAREIRWEAGKVIAHITTVDLADKWMQENYPSLPYALGLEGVAIINEHRFTEQAKVSWVVDNEMAIQLNDGGYRVVTISEEPEWHVLIESVPSYQSSVVTMSDDELRASIDALRNNRMPQARKERAHREAAPAPDKNDPVALALASMNPDKKLELMRKLGMVD